MTKFLKSKRWYGPAILLLAVGFLCHSVTSCTTNKVIVERVEFLRIDVAELKAKLEERDDIRDETLERLQFMERAIEEIIFQ